ncbi:MAG: pyridoxine 5'-phosphate synthase, partial [Muribaculaceae bacterium]|nr:pyridoxine 5'-phosphate synthase [Muribaculaceae bacterium]
IGADRVELYTKPYADNFPAIESEPLMPHAYLATLPQKAEETARQAVAPFIEASAEARKRGIGLNAGHDLNLRNLAYFRKALPLLDEVSIGHALISDALYLGIEQTIRQYRSCLHK